MKHLLEKLAIIVLLIVLAAYPVYTNLMYGIAHWQAIQQQAFIRGESIFFNPWQYRVFAPYLIEAITDCVKLLLPAQTDGEKLYFSIFKLTRFFQHLLIFGIAWKYYQHFTKNRIVLFLTLIFLSNAIGKSTLHSDFSFNNYFDVIFYLLAVYIIFSEKDILWFLPITFLAALNRETSLLIPFILFLNYKHFYLKEFRKKSWLVFLLCLTIAVSVLIMLRVYYGYPPPAPIGKEPGLPMLLFNITDPGTILEHVAAFSVIPLLALFSFSKLEKRLQLLFLLIVPVWYGIHFWLVWARETRNFMVPFAIIFLPAVLTLYQQSIGKLQGISAKQSDFK